MPQLLDSAHALQNARDELQNELQKYKILSLGQEANPLAAEIEADVEDEADTLINGVQYDADTDAAAGAEHSMADAEPHTSSELETTDTSSKRLKVDIAGHYRETLKMASSQYIVADTRREYERQWARFLQFCTESKFIASADSFTSMCLAGTIPEDTPFMIACWIMKRCDRIDLETGKVDHLSAVPKYGTAQKMRAAISHKFGRDFRRGEQPWAESQVFPGTYVGNSSISSEVSQYMVSLRRTKAQQGEVAVSAQAINENLLRRLYEYNLDQVRFPDDQGPDQPPVKRKLVGSKEPWDAGRSLRIMFHLNYVIAFLCLLRFDEALRIQWHWIEWHETDKGHPYLKVMLPYRKTHQTGDIAPFYLYPNHHKPWLCPVIAYSLWYHCVGARNVFGFVFRKKVGRTFSRNIDDGMSADSFLQCFRNNLLDINVDPRPFGTHSFRRGGCQYLATALRWPFRDICTWGGWAENYDNPGTIFKYLLSFVDAPMVDRKDYFNPDRQKADLCPACGRSCWCA